MLADRREPPDGATEWRAAAVLMGLRATVEPNTGLPGCSLVLTRRLPSLKHHPGQISLPGGACEPSDGSPEMTACREAEEEIGLPRDHIEPLFQLPVYRTVTGFEVTPVIGLLPEASVYRPDPREVAQVFEVPMSFLMNPRHHQRRGLRIESGPIEFFAMPYEQHFIWGATAAMLRNLYHFFYATWNQSDRSSIR